jgi:hypothetical protein
MGFFARAPRNDCPMSRSVERAAANELAFRKANQDIDRARAELEFTGERTPYICECEEESCTDILLLSLQEYQDVRASPRRFALSPGHETRGDIVVGAGDGFVTIEKTGREGELVERGDAPA